MIQRQCKLPKNNSFFIFGPRGSGKTTLFEDVFDKSEALFIDLLDPEIYDDFLLDISRFSRMIDAHKGKVVAIDEVQRLPKLLDIVHSRIQKEKRIFALTGSTSRRLKQKGSNLLAGRAWVFNLFPFSASEMGYEFNLQKALEYGSLPDSYLAKDADDAREYLNAYVGTYLQKEIQEEQWVRNIAPFRKFLAIAAQMNGKIINKSAIAREIGIDDVTAANYFEILEDTLIGFMLPAYHTSVRKAQRQAPKFYFIDTGITRALNKMLSIPLMPGTSAYGEAFEHWVIPEIKKHIHYLRLDWELSYIRTKDDLEIDLVVNRPGLPKLLIEIKSKSRVSGIDAKALESLGPDIDEKSERWILSNDKLEQKFGNVTAMHWRDGLSQIVKA